MVQWHMVQLRVHQDVLHRATHGTRLAYTLYVYVCVCVMLLL